MGIPGLTSYLDSLPKLWRTIELRDTRLVVDGSCLMYYLYFNYELDCRFGGQYKEFEAVISSFFSALQAEGIKPFVILDGAYDASDKKLTTYKTRFREEIRRAHELAREGGHNSCLLPLLSRRTFIQVLSKLGIQFAVCDCEADKETASLANSWNCPVLSNDSDFFIYDVQKGYIPIYTLCWDSQPLTAQVFKAERLANHFKIPRTFLPLAGSLMGNDYISEEMLAPFSRVLQRIQTSKKCSRKASRFLSIAHFLSGFKMFQEAVDQVLQVYPERKIHDMQQCLNSSLEEYNISFKSSLVEFFNEGEIKSLFMSVGDLGIPEWVLQKFRKGLFPVKYMTCLTTQKQFLRVQVENVGEMSSHNCSLKLRKVIYSILFPCDLLLDFAEKVNKIQLEESVHTDLKNSKCAETVTNAPETKKQEMTWRISEWDREGKALKQRIVEPCGEHVHPLLQPCPSLANIPMLNQANGQDFLLSILECKNIDLLKELEGKFLLLVATLIFWVKNASPKVSKQYLEALLVSFFKLDLESDLKAEKLHTRNPHFDLTAAHSYAQWQCVLSEAMNLNLILGEPLPTPFMPSVYSGKVVHEALQNIRQGTSVVSLVDCPVKFKDLYHIVAENITPDSLPNLADWEVKKFRKASPKKLGKKLPKDAKARSKGHQVLPSSSNLSNNRFGILCEGIDSCDSDDS